MPSKLLILCHPLLLPPSVFPSIRVFSSESVLRIRWPKVDDLSPFKFVETCLILHTTRAVFLNLALSACGENKVISLVSLLMRPLIPFMEASPSWPKCFPQSTSSKYHLIGDWGLAHEFWENTNSSKHLHMCAEEQKHWSPGYHRRMSSQLWWRETYIMRVDRSGSTAFLSPTSSPCLLYPSLRAALLSSDYWASNKLSCTGRWCLHQALNPRLSPDWGVAGEAQMCFPPLLIWNFLEDDLDPFLSPPLQPGLGNRHFVILVSVPCLRMTSPIPAS